MYKVIFTTIVIVLNLLKTCAQDLPTGTGSPILKTLSGFEYQWMRKSFSARSISVDDYVFFNMTLSAGDSVLQSTHRPSVLTISEDNIIYGQLKPLVDLMATLEVGDSIRFFMPVESFENKPPVLENLDGPLVYSVGIVSTMNETEFETYSDSLEQSKEKERQVHRDRLPEIESLMRKFWTEYKKGQKDDVMIAAGSGLRYLILEQGEKGNKPEAGDVVSVHYYGILESNGEMFDASFTSGNPYQFPIGLGQVIPGWDKGIPLFNIGSRGILFVPANLAYGEAGHPPVIPAGADLLFYVEVAARKH